MPKISPFLKQCFVTAAVCSNTIGFGCCIGFPAVLLPQLQKSTSFIPVTTDSEVSWIASAFALSSLLGIGITPLLMDRLGRKIAHYVLGVIFLLGWFMTIYSTSVADIIFGRVLHGISAGIINTLRSVLIGEYTSPRNRGAFITTMSLSQAFGVFFVHLLGSFFSWQMTALICVFFPFISLIMTIYTPESPSWLLAKGRYDECRNVFKWLRGEEENEELEDMIEARIAFKKTKIQNKTPNWFKNTFQIIRKKEFYKPILIVFHCNVMMHFAGGTTLAVYSTVVLGLLMGPNANAHFWMVFLDAQRIVSNFVGIFIIDKIKRRTMVISTTGLCIASQIAIAVYTYIRYCGWEYESIWLPALLINIQFFTVAIGMFPMPNVIGGEVFPLEYRSIGGMISLISGGGVMFIVLKIFPMLLENLKLHGTSVLFAIILVLNLIIVWVLLPETKGRTLQQIEDEFRGRPLKLEEIEAKQSLHLNPAEAYKRKLSEISGSNSFLSS